MKIKRYLSLVFALIMVVTLTACKGDDGASVTQESTTFVDSYVTEAATESLDATEVATAPSTTELTTQATTTEPTTVVTTTAVTTTKDTTIDSKEEIVSLFNDSANKVKKNAKKVIRNYENIRHDERDSDYPVALRLAYRSLINSWMVDHDTPIEYAQSDLIKENFPVKGKDWSSRLQASDVDAAEITEKDGK